MGCNRSDILVPTLLIQVARIDMPARAVQGPQEPFLPLRFRLGLGGIALFQVPDSLEL